MTAQLLVSSLILTRRDYCNSAFHLAPFSLNKIYIYTHANIHTYTYMKTHTYSYLYSESLSSVNALFYELLAILWSRDQMVPLYYHAFRLSIKLRPSTVSIQNMVRI